MSGVSFGKNITIHDDGDIDTIISPLSTKEADLELRASGGCYFIRIFVDHAYTHGEEQPPMPWRPITKALYDKILEEFPSE